MQEDRQSRIDELVQSALALQPEERASYLSEVCSDHHVLEEVTRALAHFPSSPKVPYSHNVPAVPGTPEATQPADPRLGESFGSYRINRRIGSGGMGEVYLAFDMRLGRQVALKFLPAQTTSDEKILRRFQLEARSASALNHPNILTIFDVGKFEHEHYIASEFVEGTTLRVRLRRGRFEISDALEVVTQVASALVAAHSAGVIHRDLKPTNIMLRPDGYVKVIDFGLAKRTRQAAGDASEEPRTQPGTMLGTADYMSPEQARGEEVDGRADLWSVGVIFYEMLAGERPFQGESEYHVIAHILDSDPKPLSPAGVIPPEVERILSRCLEKERQRRYESAAELYGDLREARRALNLSSIASKAAIVPPPVRLKRWYWIPVLAGLALAVVGGWWWSTWGRELLTGPEPFEYSEIRKVTYRGQVKLASISPDGRYVAFVSGAPRHEELCVKPMDSNYDSTLVASSNAEYRGVTFSNDGQYVYFVTRTGEYGTLRKIAITGGDPQVVESDVDGPVAVNPEGAELAFRRGNQGKQYVVFTGGRFGSKEVVEPIDSSQLVDHHLAWSPSGGHVALFVYPSSSQSPMLLKILIAKTAAVERELPIRGWNAVSQPAWMPNAKDLIVSVEQPDETQFNMQLEEVSALTGKTRDITAGLYGYLGASLTRDGKQLVTVRFDKQTRFWFGDRSDLSNGHTRAADSGQYDSVSWTSDGNLVAQANRGEGVNAWLIDVAGNGRPRILTRGPSVNRDPAWIPGEQSIVFASERNGSPGIWRLDVGSGQYRRLATAQEYVESPVCTPDGGTVIYTAWDLVGPAIWSAPTDPARGTAKLLLRNARYAVLSPDTHRLAVEENLDQRGFGDWRVAIYEYPAMKFVEAMPQTPAGSRIKWSPDGVGLNYLVTDDQGTSNIWLDPLSGNSLPRRVTSFQEDQIFDYSWSPDGTKLVCLRGRILSDAFDLIRKP